MHPSGLSKTINFGNSRGLVFSMDLVFEGALSESWSMKDVLGSIAGACSHGLGLLRLASFESGIEGKILVFESAFIIGAQLIDSDESDSYQALKTLLSLNSGNYAFMSLGAEQASEMEASLNISLRQLLHSFELLPQSSAELFDQKALLDIVFGSGKESSSKPALVEKPGLRYPQPARWTAASANYQAEKTASLVPPAPITQWEILEPLFSQPSRRLIHSDKTAGNTSGSMIPDYVHMPDGERSSFTRLKSLSEPKVQEAGPGRSGKEAQEPFKWLLSALGLSS